MRPSIALSLIAIRIASPLAPLESRRFVRGPPRRGLEVVGLHGVVDQAENPCLLLAVKRNAARMTFMQRSGAGDSERRRTRIVRCNGGRGAAGRSGANAVDLTRRAVPHGLAPGRPSGGRPRLRLAEGSVAAAFDLRQSIHFDDSCQPFLRAKGGKAAGVEDNRDNSGKAVPWDC